MRSASGRGRGLPVIEAILQAPMGFRASGISWILPKFTASGTCDRYHGSDTQNGNTDHLPGHSKQRPSTLTASEILRAKRHPSRNSQAPSVIICEPPARRRNLTVGSSFRQPRLGSLPTRRGLFLLFNTHLSSTSGKYPDGCKIIGPTKAPLTPQLISAFVSPLAAIFSSKKLSHSSWAVCHVSARKRQISAGWLATPPKHFFSLEK